jgi:hypothetical protein
VTQQFGHYSTVTGRVQRWLERWDQRNQSSFDFEREHPDVVQSRAARGMRWALLAGCGSYVVVSLVFGDFDLFAVLAIVVGLATAHRIYRSR